MEHMSRESPCRPGHLSSQHRGLMRGGDGDRDRQCVNGRRIVGARPNRIAELNRGFLPSADILRPPNDGPPWVKSSRAHDETQSPSRVALSRSAFWSPLAPNSEAGFNTGGSSRLTPQAGSTSFAASRKARNLGASCARRTKYRNRPSSSIAVSGRILTSRRLRRSPRTSGS